MPPIDTDGWRHKNILIVNYNSETVDRIKQGLLGLDANVFSVQSTHEVLQYLCYTLTFGKNLEINPLSRQVWLNGKNLRLTRKDFDLLFCLASNPEQVFSREQLYDHVGMNILPTMWMRL